MVLKLEFSAKPFDRYFNLVETIAKYGPVTIDQLGRKLNIPKSTLYRLVQTLLEIEWVVKRNIDGALLLSSKLDQTTSHAAFQSEEYAELSEYWNLIKGNKNLYFTAVYVSNLGEVSLIDATVGTNLDANDAPACATPEGKAALSCMQPRTLENAITHMLEADVLVTPINTEFEFEKFRKEIRSAIWSIKLKGFHECKHSRKISIPYLAKNGACCSLTIGPRNMSAVASDDLGSAISKIRKKLEQQKIFFELSQTMT